MDLKRERDHLEFEPIKRIKKDVKSLRDLIEDLDSKELIDALLDFDQIVNIEELKKQLINQLIYLFSEEPDICLHTIVTGPEGCGKTLIINLLAKIYSLMNVYGSSKIVTITSSDIISKQPGITTFKVKKLIKSAIGGVLLIDNILINNKKSFCYKEFIDVLNQYLHFDNFICITTLINYDLENRFAWKFEIKDYEPDDLVNIINYQVLNTTWNFKVDSKYVENQIKKNKDLFSNNGIDTKFLVDKCKICHIKRVKTPNFIKEITKDDFDKGFKMFKENKLEDEEESRDLSMYV